MKNFITTLAIAIIVLATTSCVEQSDKYQNLLAQRNQLLIMEQNYNQALDIINEVDSGFQSIKEIETGIAVKFDEIEGKSLSKKDQFTMQINQIKEILEQNKSKIASLQGQLAQSNKRNKSLSITLERMNNELNEKTAQIEALQAELAKKDVTIGELRATIEGLNANIAGLNEASASQQAVITTQHHDMNRAWYVVGNSKTLKAQQIVSSNGLFRSKSVLNKNFDNDAFTQVDLNQFTILHTNSKRPRILSSHPEGSYVMNVGADKLVTIEIEDPAKFWSISKYLVVQTER